MKEKLLAVFTIIRFPNLFFICLSQCIIGYELINKNTGNKLALYHYILLAISTTLIAAAGYVINDYFDVKIDEINKPHRVTVEINFKRRSIILWHTLLNAIALIIAIFIAIKAGHISLAIIQIICITVLVFYSSHFKRQPFIGNFVVALLSALTVLLPLMYNSFVLTTINNTIIIISTYCFLLSLIREITKDLEDYIGDETDACRTLPIVIGVNKTKLYLKALAIISILLCVYHILHYNVFTLKSNNTWSNTFTSILPIIISLIIYIYLLIKANTFKDFKSLSRIIKILLFWGTIILLWI